MVFKVGQKVVIRRNLGKKSGHSAREYYYGGNIGEVPLGTKGIISEVNSKNKIYEIRLKNNGRCWWVHSDELITSEEQIQAEKEQQEKYNPILEKALLESPIEQKTLENSTRQKPFEPKFNVREEFAVWIREQFPELEKYSEKNRVYEELESRKKEIMQSARIAYNHAMETAMGCAKICFEVAFARLFGDRTTLQRHEGNALDIQNGEFKYFYMTEEDENIEHNSKKCFAKYLEGFVIAIERSSLNLPSKNGKNYGTHERQ